MVLAGDLQGFGCRYILAKERPLFANRSLKTKMTAAMAVMTAALLSALAFTALAYFERGFKTSLGQQQFTLVSGLAREMDQKIEHAQAELLGLAPLLPLDQLGDPAALQTFLEKHRGWVGHFDAAIAVLSASGKVLAFSPVEAELAGKDLSFRPHIRQTLVTGKPQISDPFFSVQQNGHPVVAFTAPVLGPDGEVVAILAGAIDLLRENFLGALAATTLGQTGYLYLYGTDRTIIVHPDRSRILQRDVPPGANRLFDLAIEGFEGPGETVTSRGLHAFSSFKRLQSRDWILAANYPVAEGLAAVTHARRFMLLALAGFTVLALLITRGMMHYLLTPLLSLTDSIRRMTGDEKLPTRVRLAAGGEIGALATAFNRLLEETEKRKRALRDNLLFHQALIETIPVPLWYKDRDGRFLGANSAFAAAFGEDRQSIVGKTVFDLAPPGLAADYDAADRSL
ncbi:MAG: PAS domain-containing protein, partial [Desulfuromonadales bacterium]|nr:PAS domain-containing protein [Desulfuromonadales bacterium]